MAHNLNYNTRTGNYSFFSVKEKAWHHLGQIVKDYPTSAEAIRFAGLDYKVEKRKLFTYHGEAKNETIQRETPACEIPSPGQTSEVPGHFATIRTDTAQVLGVVGRDYQVVQNRDAFSFFDSIVGGGHGIQYETAGALGNGERIFITARLPEYIKVGKEDLIEQYLFLTTSHDGSGSIMAAFTPVRVVCQNTLNAALKNCSNSVRIRHTSNAKERLEQAHKVMGISCKLSQYLESAFNHWSKVRITDKELRKLIELAMAPNKETLQFIKTGRNEALSAAYKNMCDAVYQYGLSAPGQQTETARGTVFGAYNSVTGYFQNIRNYKSEEVKLKSLLFGGTAQQRTQRAFDLCLDFALKGEFVLQLN